MEKEITKSGGYCSPAFGTIDFECSYGVLESSGTPSNQINDMPTWNGWEE